MATLQLTAGVRRFLTMRNFAMLRRNLSGHHEELPERFKDYGIRDMNHSYPIPNRTYKESYDRRQAKYNKYLILSALLLASAVTFVISTDTFAHMSAPPRKVNLD